MGCSNLKNGCSRENGNIIQRSFIIDYYIVTFIKLRRRKDVGLQKRLNWVCLSLCPLSYTFSTTLKSSQ